MGAAEAAADGAVAVTPAPHASRGLLRGLAQAPQEQGGGISRKPPLGRPGGGDGGH